jgi:uncharacterized protein YbjT (DUF2867 family)
MARRPERAQVLADAGLDLVRGDVLEPDSLRGPVEGISTAYYLVHSMGRGAAGGYAERDRTGARNFAAAAKAAGVGRLIYLGGLGEPGSEHLRSRHETAMVLRQSGIPLTYFRAAAVLGAESESFRTVLYLVKRLPAMITPRWTTTRTQPIAIADVLAYLAGALDIPDSADREIEIGGPDVTTYGGLIDAMARALETWRRPRITVPVLSPRLSSLWIGLVTPVDAGVARPLVAGLETETVVTDPQGMQLFDVDGTPIEAAMRAALTEGGAP